MCASQSKEIVVQGVPISISDVSSEDYICLTDMARHKSADNPGRVIIAWLSTVFTVNFIGLWEQMHNPSFKLVEYDKFKRRLSEPAFVLSAKEWIEKTGAIGIVSKRGRYGGTYAHRHIAFEFASWISPEFKYYLISEFERLKQDEQERLSNSWSVQRTLAKVNYRIHTDAIKDHIIPALVTKSQIRFVYASEADVLNVAIFGVTAKQWRERNPDAGKKLNMRDDASLEQLVVLSNLESINALLIEQGKTQSERLVQLNEVAISQLTSLAGNAQVRELNS